MLFAGGELERTVFYDLDYRGQEFDVSLGQK